MRVLYHDPKNSEESAAFAETSQRIEAWWGDFAARAEGLAIMFRTGGALGGLPEWMTERLREIVPNVCWEFGPALQTKGFRLVITCEGDHARRPLVSLLLSRAPDLPGWEFYPYKPAESPELAEQTLRGRTGRSLENVTAGAALSRFNRIDLTFYSPSCEGAEDKRALLDAHIAAETLLGEETVHKWIGTIGVAAAPNADAGAPMPLAKLQPAVEGMIAEIRAKLPAVPRCDSAHSQFKDPVIANYQFSPHPSEDYVGRRGIVVLNTREPDVFRAALKGRPFFSETFSSRHETFCYLKIDGKAGLDPKRRVELEAAIEKVLAPAGIGCVLGGAMGLRYSYVDLALLDVSAAVKLLFPLLRKKKLPKRTWLLFLDSSLAAEWIGLYPDSPEPMLPTH